MAYMLYYTGWLKYPNTVAQHQVIIDSRGEESLQSYPQTCVLLKSTITSHIGCECPPAEQETVWCTLQWAYISSHQRLRGSQCLSGFFSVRAIFYHNSRSRPFLTTDFISTTLLTDATSQTTQALGKARTTTANVQAEPQPTVRGSLKIGSECPRYVTRVCT
ncbi:hypothetical protein PHLGIDRAFT_206456 [Phlebiopsis gigantea 11061_1 CR5-6]|uniref:Uncharacterized protein n=1 Tax=Phlebiopsis gigantea (strain 11061_1 CR5-6) TaxID=745531 RepID=A0A0C3PF25_PHLG1|nr:hypothetical protein PHLGIDRAFT_206456 [Phlebiopsis gigantea 11061_1 CR5-6]